MGENKAVCGGGSVEKGYHQDRQSAEGGASERKRRKMKGDRVKAVERERKKESKLVQFIHSH